MTSPSISRRPASYAIDRPASYAIEPAHHDIAPSVYGYFVVTVNGNPAMICQSKEQLLEWLGELNFREASARKVYLVSVEEERWKEVTDDVAGELAMAWGGVDCDTEPDDFPGFASFHAPGVCDSVLAEIHAANAGLNDERASFYSHANRGTW